MENRLVIIDGNSLINRAYYAMQRPMITKEGIYTQGIYGFLNMLEKIKKDYEPKYIGVAFDVKAPTFRHKAYDEYKAGRKKMPLELVMQMPILKEILEAMNIKIVELEGFEADDLIGTIAREGEENDLRPLIITGDKDALQLATDKTEVLITKKGISQFDLFDEKTFIEKYGFTPIQFIDCKGLMGDKSDNIPGVPGIGEVGATKLIVNYGSIENIYEKIDEVTPKGTQKKLMENHQLAFLSKKLATINRYVPIEINFEEYLSKEPDYIKLVELYKKLEFNSFLKKIDIPLDQAKNSEIVDYKLVFVDDDNKLEDFKRTFQGVDEVGIKIISDDSHKSIPKVRGIFVSAKETVFGFINDAEKKYFYEIISLLKKVKKDIYGHDLKNEIYNLLYLGISDVNLSFDTAIAEYVIDSSRSDYLLETLASEILQVNLHSNEDEPKEQIDMFEAIKSPEEEFKSYGRWFAVCDEIKKHQKELLQKEELWEVFMEAELPLVEVMAYMEYVGFRVDKDYLEKIGADLTAREKELTKEIHQLAGEKFNIKSPKQLGPILFEKLELPVIKKTKTGYSTGAEILEKLKDKHPIVPLILEYRKLTKLNSTYVEGLIPVIASDGKIHASFNQTVTTTGRISSSNPNMQNIPVKEEIGKKIRGAFIPSDENYTLVGADYSQIELRVLAHMSGDEALIEAFNKGQDIHRATAARVMGIPEDEITPIQRSNAKAVNFGVIYGMSSFGLSSELNITRKEAEKYINDYFDKHQAVKDFMDMQVAFSKEHGFVKTILGRKRYIKEIKASNFNVRQLGERLAMNTPIQGSAADIIKLAMIKVYNSLKGMKSRLILQVHDELIIEAHIGEVDQVKEILRENMENAIKLGVALSVDLNSGDNWLDLK